MSVHAMSAMWGLDLKPTQLLIALALADHADKDGGGIWPSVATISNKTGIGERQVQRLIRELENTELLIMVREATRWRPREYRLDLNARLGVTPMSPLDESRGDTHDGSGVTPTTPRGDTHDTLTVIEPPLEPSNPPKPADPPGSASLSEARQQNEQLQEARPQDALGWGFSEWANRLRPGGNVTLTARRKTAYLSRRKHDGFTDAQLFDAILGAEEAVNDDVLNNPHRESEFYRLFMDRGHVAAWREYHRTGDVNVITDMLIAEETISTSQTVIDEVPF